VPHLQTIPPHRTTTVLRPFFRDHLGEPVPEENFWTLWCKGRLAGADTPTIRLGATPSGLSSAHLHHPPSPNHTWKIMRKLKSETIQHRISNLDSQDSREGSRLWSGKNLWSVSLVVEQSPLSCLSTYTASPPVDVIWAMMIVWRIRGKIIRTVLCYVVYDSCTQWYTHTSSSYS